MMFHYGSGGPFRESAPLKSRKKEKDDRAAAVRRGGYIEESDEVLY